MNKDALTIPKDRLGVEFQKRVQRKQEILDTRDAELGVDRIPITSYMENIGWPELFGFDMNDFFADPELAFEMQLRERIFWADNSLDDSYLDRTIYSDTGMYFDTTLFGTEIHHTKIGVPEFQPHPISQNPDPSIIKPFDFYQSGDMPLLIERYKKLKEISTTIYDNYFPVDFPGFHRGPVDIYVQLRGYENFLTDTVEKPEIVHEFLDFFVNERSRYRKEREAFLGTTDQTASPCVADDWVAIPFISPDIFMEFIIPAYRKIVANEGPVAHFHTCGRIDPIFADMLAVFPEISTVDMSWWNIMQIMDEIVPKNIAFAVAVINTFTLCSPPDEQRQKFEEILKVSKHRKVSLNTQAIVKLLATYEETMAKMNHTITLARSVFCNR
jgi:uroporphyrinogen-III decarboxylase